MCLIVIGFSLIDRFTNLKPTLIWIVEPLEFAYGILAYRFHNKIQEWINEKWLVKIGVFMILSAILGLTYLKFKTIYFFGDYLLKILLGISITAFIYEVISKIKVGNRLNHFLGKISYEVYLVHGLIFTIISRLDIGYRMNSGGYIALSLLASIVMASFVHLLSAQIVKRIQIKRISF